MNLTDAQKALLRVLVSTDESVGGKEFMLARSHTGAGLCYPGGKSVSVSNEDTDFLQLQREGYITLRRNHQGLLCGKPTKRGTDIAQQSDHFPDDKSAPPSEREKRRNTPVDPWSVNPFPKGTPAHQHWTDTARWAKEHLALFQASRLENMPPEEASPKQFLDYLLETLAGTFDIWARAFSRHGVRTDKSADAFEHLLGGIEELMVEQADQFRINFISKQVLLSEIKSRLNARKQYWIGLKLREVREYKEASQAQPAVKPGDVVEPAAARWDQIEILFLSDERVQINHGTKTETWNYAELGFVDRRNGKANRAWLVLRALAEASGVIRDAVKTDSAWSRLEKRIQEIREVLRKHFGIDADPVPFVQGTGYSARFKIGCGPSFHA